MIYEVAFVVGVYLEGGSVGSDRLFNSVKNFQKWLYCFISPSVMYRGSHC